MKVGEYQIWSPAEGDKPPAVPGMLLDAWVERFIFRHEVRTGIVYSPTKRREVQIYDRMIDSGWVDVRAFSNGAAENNMLVEHMRACWLREYSEGETFYWEMIDCARHGWRVNVQFPHHDGEVRIAEADQSFYLIYPPGDTPEAFDRLYRTQPPATQPTVMPTQRFRPPKPPR
jgi:hypothetical protein